MLNKTTKSFAFFICMSVVIACLGGCSLQNSTNSMLASTSAGISQNDKRQNQNSDSIAELTKKCELYDASSCYKLGNKFYRGEGVEANYDAALSYYDKSCNLLSVEACNALGKIYYEGKVVKQDIAAAKDLFHTSCELHNNGEACYYLGVIYFKEKSSELNLNTAANMFYKSCVLKYPEACSRLGQMYASGQGLEQDLDKARLFYNQGCYLGNISACRDLGSMSAINNESQSIIGNKDSKNSILQKCNHNNTKACTVLAKKYYDGNSVKKDLALVNDLLQKGCNLNDGPSCSMLGLLYSKGDGISQNQNKAIAKNLLKKGCDLNVGISCDNLGGILYNPKTTVNKDDLFIAEKSFQKGCDLNIANSCFRLGHMYHFSNNKNSAARDKYLQKACNLNDKLSCRFLGLIYWNGGKTSKQNLEQAKALMEKGCDLGEGAACGDLAAIYSDLEKANGYITDSIEVFQRNQQLLTKACDLNDGLSCFLLGGIYEIKRDFAQAKKVYQRGCKLHDKDSCDALEKLGIQVKKITNYEEEKRQQKLIEQKQKAQELEADLDAIIKLVMDTNTR